MYTILLFLVQLITLLLFIIAFFKAKRQFFLFASLHILTGLICYAFDFQPWMIEFFILVWVITGFFIVRNKYHGELKQWTKIALVSITIIHAISWGDAFHERLIHAGLFHSHLVTNVVIDEDYTIQGWRPSDRPYYFKTLINKKDWIFQKRTELFGYNSVPLDAKSVEWIPLEGDSVRIIIPGMVGSQSKTIYLPDF